MTSAWSRWGRDLVTFIAVGLAAWSVWASQASVSQSEKTVRRLDHESAERQDQSCRITEAKQQSDIEALSQTYKYLASLSPEQLAEPLNRTVLANLPRTIRDAELDDAPAYCKRPGIGLDPSTSPFPQPPPNLPKP